MRRLSLAVSGCAGALLACRAAPQPTRGAAIALPAPPLASPAAPAGRACRSWSKLIARGEIASATHLLPTSDGGVVGVMMASGSVFEPPLGEEDSDARSLLYALDACGDLRYASELRLPWRSEVFAACVDEHDGVYLAGTATLPDSADPHHEAVWFEWRDERGAPVGQRDFVSHATYPLGLALSAEGQLHALLDVGSSIEIEGKTLLGAPNLAPGSVVSPGARVLLALDRDARLRYTRELPPSRTGTLTSGGGVVFLGLGTRFVTMAPGDPGYVPNTGLSETEIEAVDIDGNVRWRRFLRTTSSPIADGAGGLLGRSVLRAGGDPLGEPWAQQVVRFDSQGNETLRISIPERPSTSREPARQARAPFAACQTSESMVSDGRGRTIERAESALLLADAEGALIGARELDERCSNGVAFAWATDGSVVTSCRLERDDEVGLWVEKWDPRSPGALTR